jgi:DNA-binding NarL/FixJ family response regulator
MGLVGNLEDLSLRDILHLINLSARTGILKIENPEGRSVIAFKDGAIVFASSELININLPKMLVEMGKLSQHKLDQIFTKLRQKSSTSFTAELINSGLLNTKIIYEIAKKYFQAVIQRLVSYEEGKFSFSLEESISLEKINFKPTDIYLEEGINPQNILVDAAKTTDDILHEINNSTQKAFKDFISQEQGEDDLFFLPGTSAEDGWESDFWKTEEEKEEEATFEAEETRIDRADLRARLAASASIEKNLVLIDDESFVREQISKNMRNYGLTVYSCITIEEALNQCRSLYQQGKNTIIVVDLIMSSFDPTSLLGGLDLLEKVSLEMPGIPVALMTEYTDVKVRHKAYLLGAINYLFKPDSTKVSIDAIESVYSQFSEELVCILLPIFETMEKEKRSLEKAEPRSIVGRGRFSISDSDRSLRKQICALKEMIEELQHPESSSQISLLALRLASEVLERAFLFLVKSEEYVGVGGFGLSTKVPITEKLRGIRIPLWKDCIFDYVLETKCTFKGKIPDSQWNRYLIEQLEGYNPREVVIIPIMSKARVIALLYGDNKDHDKPIDTIEGIEIFMSQVGIAFENAVLERKLRSLIPK